MQQILGLRDYFDKKKQRWDKTDNTFFGRGWGAHSVRELFKDIDQHLAKIPESERYNLFYTVAFCTEKKREFREQNVMVFDIDGLDTEKLDQYIEITCSGLGVTRNKTAIVFSGNGLHFIIGLSTPIAEALFFEKNRRHYNAICANLDLLLRKEGLPGAFDPAVFDPRRIMRLPGTLNIKEGKPNKECWLIKSDFEDVDFSLQALSGLPEIEASQQINPQSLKKYPKPDTDAVILGCDFIKWCKEKPNDVSEAQWYAMLSIVPRCPPRGREIAHEYSSGHAGYSSTETEAKMDQALQASGPRTCDNINNLWGKCSGCKNFNKVNSPIMIQGDSFIKTRENGFYNVKVDDKGNITKGTPNYEDLRRYFEELHPYHMLGGSGICLIYNGTHWEQYDTAYLDGFAQENFNPKPLTKICHEFSCLIRRTNFIDPDWFTESIQKKMNFKNGVLDLITMELEPHSSEYGFRYCLDYNYDPEATAPTFEKFMLDIMDQRQALVDILLEFAGYAFSNDECWEAKCLFLTGEGSNGKSTFLNVLKKAAGKDNYSAVSLSALNKPTSLKLLDGKLFNLTEETPSNAMLESELFKNLVGGGDATVKALYHQEYTIESKTKFMFACNTLPKTKDSSYGYFRRIIPVPFDVKFDGIAKDPFMKHKLFKELPGIFNLIIAAYHGLKARGFFEVNDIVETEVENYRLETDTVREFVKSCITIDPLPSDNWVAVNKLYASYRDYAEKQGERAEVQSVFNRRLAAMIKEQFNDLRNRRKQKIEAGVKLQGYFGISYADLTEY